MAFSEIRVIKNGQPLKGARVVLSFDGIGNIGHTSPGFTDNNGRVLIEHSSSGMTTIYIDGKETGKMKAPGQHKFYL